MAAAEKQTPPSQFADYLASDELEELTNALHARGDIAEKAKAHVGQSSYSDQTRVSASAPSLAGPGIDILAAAIAQAVV